MANTRAQQTTLISANIPDNNEKLVTPAKVREVDNAGVSAYAFVDDDNDFTGVQTHAKEVRWHKGADLASASTLALGATGNYHHVTGTTTITGLSTKQHGTTMKLYFVAALTLTHSSALVLPNSANLNVLAGDIVEFVSEGSGNWRCTNYSPASNSGDWTPTLTLSGFDSASNIASQYQIVGNYCLFQCRVEAVNSGLPSAGIIGIEPPLGLTAGVTVATVSLRNIGVVALFSDILVEQASGLIQITAEFATPTIGAYEFVISGSFLIA
jgi:hypothetical protein